MNTPKTNMNTPKINGTTKLTDNKFLNMYELDVQHRNGASSKYHVASRAKSTDELSATTGKVKPTAVVMLGTYEDNLVLIRQYRYPIGGYIYELPAGLIDEGEDVLTAAKREMFEETGLAFIPSEVPWNINPWLSSPGMTDEACDFIFGKCVGKPTNENQESSEDIQVILADKQEAMRILNEETVDMRAAFAIISVFGIL
jgi:ADP-ribose pyrophosphatase